MLIGLMPMQLTHVHALYYYLGHTYQYDGRIMNRSCLSVRKVRTPSPNFRVRTAVG